MALKMKNNTTGNNNLLFILVSTPSQLKLDFRNLALFWNNYTKITRSKNAFFRTGYLVSPYAKELTLRFFDHLSKGIL